MYKIKIPLTLATITFPTTIFLLGISLRNKKLYFAISVKNRVNKNYKWIKRDKEKEIVGSIVSMVTS